MILALLLACADKTEPTAIPSLLTFSDTPQNILVITWDTTRPDLFGRITGADTTPTLDALLADSLVLENHRSCSNWTYASMVCVQTGTRDVEAGFIPSTLEGVDQVPGDLLLVSELLYQRGYQTLVVGDQPFMSDYSGLDAGFQTVWMERDSGAAVVTDQALSHLSDLGDGPWYAHIQYTEPHAPYAPPEAYLAGLEGLPEVDYDLDRYGIYTALKDKWPELEESAQETLLQHLMVRYLAGLRYTDDQLARLLDGVSSLGLMEDTLVVFLTDHGEQIFEHGTIGHADALYEQENRAIVAFHAPSLTADDDWTGPTTHADIWPTILNAIGHKIPRSFKGTVLGQRPDDTVRYALHHDGPTTYQSIEREGLKLMYWWETGEKALYQLAKDPDEQNDIYDPVDPEVIALWELLTPEIERVLAIRPDDRPVNPGP